MILSSSQNTTTKLVSNLTDLDIASKNALFRKINNLYTTNSTLSNNGYYYGTGQQHNFSCNASVPSMSDRATDPTSFINHFKCSLRKETMDIVTSKEPSRYSLTFDSIINSFKSNIKKLTQSSLLLCLKEVLNNLFKSNNYAEALGNSGDDINPVPMLDLTSLPISDANVNVNAPLTPRHHLEHGPLNSGRSFFCRNLRYCHSERARYVSDTTYTGPIRTVHFDQDISPRQNPGSTCKKDIGSTLRDILGPLDPMFKIIGIPVIPFHLQKNPVRSLIISDNTDRSLRISDNPDRSIQIPDNHGRFIP